MAPHTQQDIKELSFHELASVLAHWHAPRYRADQIMRWLCQKHARTFGDMKNLPRALLEQLSSVFFISALQCIDTLSSKDGTKKFLFRLSDTHIIETAYIPHERRRTVCVSTQVGCRYRCAFCASGALGFVRNLTSAEMVNQLVFVAQQPRLGRISNVVFMGIGEPLDNYDNLMRVIEMINAPYGFGIGQRKITISTAGQIDGIKQLMYTGVQVELSISLHSADSEKRSQIMPINKKYPLADLLTILKKYTRYTGRKITFEYMFLAGFNTSEVDARKLVRAMRGIHASVNLIAYNATRIGEFRAPSTEEVHAFRRYLEHHNVETTIRRSRGADIDAACGQLRLHHQKQ